MKKTELHPELQKRAMPVEGRSGVYAVVPMPTRQSVDNSSLYPHFARARASLELLKSRMQHCAYADLLFRLLNRREAVDSSQIEGTKTSFDELLLYEVNLDESAQIADPDAKVTLAYVNAFQAAHDQVKQHGQAAINNELIKRIHGHLLASEPQYKPGQFREIQNYIGTSLESARFVPPPAALVGELMSELEQALLLANEGESKSASVLMRAPIIHAQFEAIHPFRDGNGRTGRMLIPLMLLADDEPPLHLATFLKMRQQQYYDALLEVQMRLNWAPWIQLFLECVVASAEHSRQLIERIDELQIDWAARIDAHFNQPGSRLPRADAAIYKVLRLLPGHPVLSVKEVSKWLGVTFPAANKAIGDLETIGILRKVKQQSRNRIYQAHEILNAMFTGMDMILDQAQNPRVG